MRHTHQQNSLFGVVFIYPFIHHFSSILLLCRTLTTHTHNPHTHNPHSQPTHSQPTSNPHTHTLTTHTLTQPTHSQPTHSQPTHSQPTHSHTPRHTHTVEQLVWCGIYLSIHTSFQFYSAIVSDTHNPHSQPTHSQLTSNPHTHTLTHSHNPHTHTTHTHTTTHSQLTHSQHTTHTLTTHTHTLTTHTLTQPTHSQPTHSQPTHSQPTHPHTPRHTHTVEQLVWCDIYLSIHTSFQFYSAIVSAITQLGQFTVVKAQHGVYLRNHLTAKVVWIRINKNRPEVKINRDL